DDLVGIDADGDVALAGPVLGVDGVVFDAGVEPEAVAVGFAVIEGRLDLFTAAAASAATTSTAAFWSRAARALRLLLVALAVLALLTPRRFRLFGLFLLRRGGLDLRFDLVAEVDFAGASVLVVGGEVVLLAELAQLAGADFELVGDPGVGPALVDP